METSVEESFGRQVSRKTGHLILVSILPCMLSVQCAAALTLNEAAPDDLHTITGYRWFAEGNSIRASAQGQPADEKKLAWSFHASYMLVVGMGNRADPGKFPQIFFDRGPQIFLKRGAGPHISVRIERQF